MTDWLKPGEKRSLGADIYVRRTRDEWVCVFHPKNMPMYVIARGTSRRDVYNAARKWASSINQAVRELR